MTRTATSTSAAAASALAMGAMYARSRRGRVRVRRGRRHALGEARLSAAGAAWRGSFCSSSCESPASAAGARRQSAQPVEVRRDLRPRVAARARLADSASSCLERPGIPSLPTWHSPSTVDATSCARARAATSPCRPRSRAPPPPPPPSCPSRSSRMTVRASSVSVMSAASISDGDHVPQLVDLEVVAQQVGIDRPLHVGVDGVEPAARRMLLLLAIEIDERVAQDLEQPRLEVASVEAQPRRRARARRSPARGPRRRRRCR